MGRGQKGVPGVFEAVWLQQREGKGGRGAQGDSGPLCPSSGGNRGIRSFPAGEGCDLIDHLEGPPGSQLSGGGVGSSRSEETSGRWCGNQGWVTPMGWWLWSWEAAPTSWV